MLGAGMSTVTISNIDYQGVDTQYDPYNWRLLDGEDLDVEDNEFDWVIIQAGLHHMAIPARGVTTWSAFRGVRLGSLSVDWSIPTATG